ncbi:LytR/AlgR family response regulator transcription factor [Flavihumibacter petaseus]|uniref:Putative two-component response regulator n=1 Tax=Flavihumibacter petaseus NBRC 106054 TaxID=1220578 RepID=A0A0E9N746_9BACT|nr:response regulator transcription factor [Flavihumibacter petaseus]GAO45623.1 putative two-component response regulator [Flavihumibacter petaseus NBRC 106054]
MQKFNCLIVEDEPLAAEVLQDYISQVPFLTLKATCTDAIYALDILQQQKIDCIFLDIHLPKLKGLDFIKTLKHPPHVIITTAYQEYALDGYELDVVDYLMKPISFSRFLMAVNKLQQINSVAERQHILFNVNKKKIRVYLDEILYIESLKEYIKVTTTDKVVHTKFQIGQIEEMLTMNNFLRIHRSFLVARNRVDAFSATEVEIGSYVLPIGRSYKEAVMHALEATG